MNGLTYIRRQCNISIAELADILGVSRQAISSWENGRKELPDKRKTQLAEFFGIDEKYFGDISDEEKTELLKKAMFRWDGFKKEALLYRRSGSDSAVRGYEEVVFSKDRSVSLDEEYTSAKKRRTDLQKAIAVSIDGSDMPNMTIQGHIHVINRSCALFGTAYELAEGMKQQKTVLKMQYYFEVMNVLKALRVSMLGEAMADSPQVFYDEDDTEWIEGIAKEIADHWEKKKDKYNNLKPFNITEEAEEPPTTVSEVEKQYSQQFDEDDNLREHGLSVWLKK